MLAASAPRSECTTSGSNADSQKPSAMLTCPRAFTGFLLVALCLATLPLVPLLRPSVQHPADGVRDRLSSELAAVPLPDSVPVVPGPKSTPTVPSRTPLARCPHMVLFCGQRHGSTWFMNNIERCRYSGGRTFEASGNPRAELWNPNLGGPIMNSSPKEAAVYARDNHTIKVMPISVKNGGKENLRELVKKIARLRIPVIILRRRLEDSYVSLLAATKKGVWLVDTRGEEKLRKRNQPKLEGDPKFEAYRRKLEDFFATYIRLLEEAGASVDVLWYEKVKEKAVAVATNNQCSVKNCNFSKVGVAALTGFPSVPRGRSFQGWLRLLRCQNLRQ